MADRDHAADPAAPIVRVLNEDVGRYHRWCTPSILPDQERVQDFYASDVSISAGLLRHARRPHGRLRGGREVRRRRPRAPTARCSPCTARAARTGSCCGCSRSSTPTRWCSSRATSTTRSSTRIKAFGLDFRFLPTPYEPRFEAVLPPSVDDVLDGLARYPEALAVLYTSPTYEGLAANTRAIADAVHAASRHAMLIVDEAWGGHLRFHPDLPPSAMASGADVCVQSTHKLAGGLQQTGLIHWQDRPRGLRADGGGLPRVRHHVAQLPPAGQRRRGGAHAGRARRESSSRAIARTSELKAALRARLPDLDHLDDAFMARAAAAASRAATTSRRRSGFSRYDFSGYDVAEALIERGDRHREGRRAHDHAHHHLPARGRRGARHRARAPPTPRAHVLPAGTRQPMPANPFRAIDDRPVMHPYAARRYAKTIGHEVPLADAIGKVAAEEVEVYPPGIPLILEGFRVSADAVEYLRRGARQGRLDRRPRHVPGDAARPVSPRRPRLARDYTVRRSARARRVRVSVDPARGPGHAAPARAPSARPRWPSPSCGRGSSGASPTRAPRASASRARAGASPTSARTCALVAEAGRTRVHRRGDALLVPGRATPRPALERWYRRTARAEIAPRLDAAATALGHALHDADDPRPAHALGLVLGDRRDELQLAPAARARAESSTTSSGTRPATSR